MCKASCWPLLADVYDLTLSLTQLSFRAQSFSDRPAVLDTLFVNLSRSTGRIPSRSVLSHTDGAQLSAQTGERLHQLRAAPDPHVASN